MIPQRTLENPVSTADSHRTRPEDRAVSEILGAILLFALVVLLIALIQLNAVPAANQQVEFEHNQRVQGDLQEFDEVLLRSVSTDREGAVTIEAGTGYPSRFFLFNPQNPTGTVALSDNGVVEIKNARATGNAETEQYIDGTEVISFESGVLTYKPNYNEYQNAPMTVYENGLIFNDYTRGSPVIRQDRSFLSGRTVSVIALQGDLATTSSSPVSLGIEAISAPARTVSVAAENAAGEPKELEITVPSRLDHREWNEILSDEEYFVEAVDDGPGRVTIKLTAGETYELRMAAVGLGSGYSTDSPPRYITDIEGNVDTISESVPHRMVVEVRDKYNNPVSNVELDLTTSSSLPGDATFVEDSGRTDGDGQAVIEYTPGDVSDEPDGTITVSFGQASADEEHQVVFDLKVLDTDGNGDGDDGTTSTGDDFNPAEGLKLESATLREPGTSVGAVTKNCPRSKTCVTDITLKNTDEEDTIIRSIRLSVYSAVDGNQPNKAILAGTELNIGGDPQSPSLSQITSDGGEQTYTFEFSGFDKTQHGVVDGDIFIIEIITETGGQFKSTSYLVAPKDGN